MDNKNVCLHCGDSVSEGIMVCFFCEDLLEAETDFIIDELDSEEYF